MQQESITTLTNKGYKVESFVCKTLFGGVYILEKDNQKLCVKLSSHLKLKRRADVTTDDPFQENEYGVNLSHPRIVPYLETFDSENYTYAILPYYKHRDMFERIRIVKKISMDDVKSIMCQIFEGIDYLNDNGYVYTDLSLENIFVKNVTDKHEIILGDLGSLIKKEHLKQFILDSKIVPGKFIFKSLDYISYKIERNDFDIYEAYVQPLACLAYTFALGYYPYNQASFSDYLFQMIFTGRWMDKNIITNDKLQSLYSDLPIDFLQIINRGIKAPENRIKMREFMAYFGYS